MSFSISISRKRRWTAKNGKTVNKTRPSRLHLKRDFQNCHLDFSSPKIKEDMNFSISIGRKRRWTAKNGKTVNETWPVRLRLKRDFQNCL